MKRSNQSQQIKTQKCEMNYLIDKGYYKKQLI